MNYDRLLDGIGNINSISQAAVARAVNQVLTLRNWLIGAYLVEYEQNGEDRASYGEELLKGIAKDATKRGYTGLSLTDLKNFRKFALTYPIVAKSQTLSDLFDPVLNVDRFLNQTRSDSTQPEGGQLSFFADRSPSSFPHSKLPSPKHTRCPGKMKAITLVYFVKSPGQA